MISLLARHLSREIHFFHEGKVYVPLIVPIFLAQSKYSCGKSPLYHITSYHQFSLVNLAQVNLYIISPIFPSELQVFPYRKLQVFSLQILRVLGSR